MKTAVAEDDYARLDREPAPAGSLHLPPRGVSEMKMNRALLTVAAVRVTIAHLRRRAPLPNLPE